MHKVFNFIKKPLLGFQKLSKLKKIIVVIIVVAITIAAQQYFASQNKNGYITQKAKIGSITEIVSETGNIITTGKTDVYSPANGIVEEIYVKNGDMVLKDQELFKIKSTATVQEQQAAYATYLTAKATLDAALSTLHTLRSTMFTNWDTYRDMATNSEYENEDDTPDKEARLNAEFQSTQDTWLASEKAYKDQQTVIAKAQAAVNSTWLLYQATQNATVLAQADGTISNLAVGVGDAVEAYTGPTSTAAPILAIANFSKYTVKTSLNESDIYKASPGQEVELEADAFKNKKYKGIIDRVDDIGTNENGVIKYNVYITITNPDDKLKFGMTVDADIITNKLENILTVPNAAVKPYKNGKAVRVVDLQTKEFDYIPVEIGIKGTKTTQIINGINEGQEVITSLKNEQIKRSGPFSF